MYSDGRDNITEKALILGWVREENTYNVEEYTIGSGEKEDLLILLISAVISCSIELITANILKLVLEDLVG